MRLAMKKSVRKLQKKTKKIDWKCWFEAISCYAVEFGFGVKTHGGSAASEVDWYRKPLNKPYQISIQQGDWEKMCYELLHELGHHKLRVDWKEYTKRYPASTFAEKKQLLEGITKYSRRTSTMLDELREEFDAWDEAVKIAAELKVPIMQETYNKLKTRALTGYVRYYGGKLNRSKSTK